MKKLAVLILVLSIVACNDSSEDKLVSSHDDYQKELESSETKTLKFLSESIATEKEINIDTVDIILKEFYKEYRYFEYSDDKGVLEESDLSKMKDPIHLYDFVDKMQTKHEINRSILITVVSEANRYFKLEDIKENTDFMFSDISELLRNQDSKN